MRFVWPVFVCLLLFVVTFGGLTFIIPPNLNYTNIFLKERVFERYFFVNNIFLSEIYFKERDLVG